MILWRTSQKFGTSYSVRAIFLLTLRPTLGSIERQSCFVPVTRHVHTTARCQLPEFTGNGGLATASQAKLMATRQVGQGQVAKLPGKRPKPMSRALVQKVMGLSDVKEEVYGALDEWAAFELEFPIAATRLALDKLRREAQWHRIIQVTKWMFSKGVGKTHNAYGLLLKAYCKDGRMDEAEKVWEGLVRMLDRSMPKNLFSFMTNAYRKLDMPLKVIQIFEQMEHLGIIPDKDVLRRAGEAYQQLNLHEKIEQLGKKYAIDSRTRRKEKRLKEQKAREALHHDQREKDAVVYHQMEKDEERGKKQATMEPHQEQGASSRIGPGESLGPLQGGEKLNATAKAEAEFLKQVIDSM